MKVITENVLQISENYYESWNKANMYLFRENGESILVDTGTGVFDPVKFLIEHGFINKKPKVNTGKSYSEALILPSTNPQYEKRLLMELTVQYMKTK